MHIVEPEILNDEFSNKMKETLQNNDISYCLEIGSSTGDGSTKALFEGMKDKLNKTLICIEAYKPSFNLLREKYKKFDWIKCYNYSTISIENRMSNTDVINFYKNIQTKLNEYPIESVLSWFKQENEYLEMKNIVSDGLNKILEQYGIPDMVLIDGSPFSGFAEYEILKDVKHIFLDDINDIKCYKARQSLMNDSTYHLVWEDLDLRNGASYFAKN